MNIEVFHSIDKEFLSFYYRFIADDKTDFKKTNKEVLEHYYQLFKPLGFKNVKNIWHLLEPQRSDVFWYVTYPPFAFLTIETKDDATCSVYMAEHEMNKEPYIEVLSYQGVEVEKFIAHDTEELREELTKQLPHLVFPEYLTDKELEKLEYNYVNTRFLRLNIKLSERQRTLLKEKDEELLAYIEDDLSYETFTDFYEAIDCLGDILTDVKTNIK